MLVVLVLFEPLILLVVLVFMKRVEEWVDRSVEPMRPAHAMTAAEVVARPQARGVAVPTATLSLPLPRRAPAAVAAPLPAALPGVAPGPVSLGGGSADTPGM